VSGEEQLQEEEVWNGVHHVWEWWSIVSISFLQQRMPKFKSRERSASTGHDSNVIEIDEMDEMDEA
jgi:hypothetical protein